MSRQKLDKKQVIVEENKNSSIEERIRTILTKEERKYLFIIIAVGFILRLIFILETQNSPFIQHLFSDSKIYNDWAKEIVNNG